MTKIVFAAFTILTLAAGYMTVYGVGRRGPGRRTQRARTQRRPRLLRRRQVRTRDLQALDQRREAAHASPSPSTSTMHRAVWPITVFWPPRSTKRSN